jgi:hypothetical protein
MGKLRPTGFDSDTLCAWASPFLSLWASVSPPDNCGHGLKDHQEHPHLCWGCPELTPGGGPSSYPQWDLPAAGPLCNTPKLFPHGGWEASREEPGGKAYISSCRISVCPREAKLAFINSVIPQKFSKLEFWKQILLDQVLTLLFPTSQRGREGHVTALCLSFLVCKGCG